VGLSLQLPRPCIHLLKNTPKYFNFIELSTSINISPLFDDNVTSFSDEMDGLIIFFVST